MNPQNLNIRGGFTLTELLITMTAGGTLAILAVGMVHQTMHLTSATRREADEHRSVSRLANQFRQDVRMADQVLIESASSMRLTIPQHGEVTYVAETAACVRTHTEASTTAVAGDRVSRETYRLQPDGQVSFEMLEPPRRAALVVSRGETATRQRQENRSSHALHRQTPKAALRIEAVIGTWGERLAPRPQEVSP